MTRFSTVLFLLFLNFFFSELKGQTTVPEIIYHVCQRSFYDSDGDLHGDLKGLEKHLNYLQDLGITSILLLPLYHSVYYHNYFPIDFEKIDPEFGTEADFVHLVQEVHRRNMKIYMDMESQYITEDHIWWKDSYGNPQSQYSNYLIYNGPDNTNPESIIFDLHSLEGYDGTSRQITTINLHNEDAKKYIYDLYKYWLDPNRDGDFSDGVDGYRIDHMMDDLDWKGKLTGLLVNFWRPLFNELRNINPDVKIMGEQADWSAYGREYFESSGIDRLFDFGIKFGISSFDKEIIKQKIDSTLLETPDSKNQLIFIENHDTQRFANDCDSDPAKLKIGATLNIMLPGIPVIYYGQEIGMRGVGGFGAFGNTDGNDIPRREAFEWTTTIDQPGMALWYKDSGPWWEARNIRDNDGISVEEQKGNTHSLWNFYKKLISLRKEYVALCDGNILFIENRNANVFSFFRTTTDEKILVNINLSSQKQKLEYEFLKSGINAKLLLDQNGLAANFDDSSINLVPYGIQIIKF
ncbi:MAG: alpha-glucosidase C-terminal domain-containing protein [Saprospiraceae bacterium]|nr:alpha-glucosidase C-terminal domain-containing protein [Saprospiraceae bacterium]